MNSSMCPRGPNGRAACRALFALAVLGALPDNTSAQDSSTNSAVGGAAIIAQCAVPFAPMTKIAPIPSVMRAVGAGRLRILAIGSSSTSGVGASSELATYPARLTVRLRRLFPGVQIKMTNRGIPGETLVGAAARMKFEARRVRPDLVLWQLGTNGALNKIEISRLREHVTKTLQWLRERDIGVLLIDPQYVQRFDKFEHYARVVAELARLAAVNNVGLIRRYDSMRAIAERRQLSDYLASDRFHLNDLGYRCLANYAAHAIGAAAR